MRIALFTALAAVSILIGNARADVLQLKEGPRVEGTLISANSREVTFLSTAGVSKTYPIGSVATLDFKSLPAAPPAAPKPAPAPTAPAAALTVPAGTQIVIRTIDAIDGSTARSGARYRASVEDAVVIGGRTAVPRGASCTVEVVALAQGEDITLRLRDINVGGKSLSTSTEYVESEATGTSKGKKAARRGMGLGAAGAGIGALAGGGKGAAIGAAVGGGVGAISAAGAKGKQIKIPTETRLIFALKAPLTVK